MKQETKIFRSGKHVFAAVLAVTVSQAAAPKAQPAAPKAAVHETAAPSASSADRFAVVESALQGLDEALRGGSETARCGAEAPFAALQNVARKPAAPTVVAAAPASANCPNGGVRGCDYLCVEPLPTGGCAKWIPVNCGCR